jgi:hypothetical protein
MTKRFLMVEDTEDNRQILRDHFDSTDHDLIEGGSRRRQILTRFPGWTITVHAVTLHFNGGW